MRIAPLPLSAIAVRTINDQGTLHLGLGGVLAQCAMLQSLRAGRSGCSAPRACRGALRPYQARSRSQTQAITPPRPVATREAASASISVAYAAFDRLSALSIAVKYRVDNPKRGFWRLSAPRRLAPFGVYFWGRSWSRSRSWLRGRSDDRLRRRGLLLGTRPEERRGNHDGNHRRITEQPVVKHTFLPG